jgi:DNA-binding transcriptional MerR regulator
MRITEVALRSGLSVDTIRYYEKAGLIPAIDRGKGGRRTFSDENVDWITLLYWLRETGMPMKTMKTFAELYSQGDQTIPKRKEILLSHSLRLDERREALDRCADILAYKLSIYRDYEG